MEQQFPITIIVHGKAEPAGSKTARVITRKDPETGQRVPVYDNRTGRYVTSTYDANKKAKGWKTNVSEVAAEQYDGDLLDGALVVEMIFYVPRPKGHFGTGRNAGVVKDSAPAFPKNRPDGLKLARAMEDALTGVVWTDDARIVTEMWGKRFGDSQRVEIKVWLAQEQMVRDLIANGAIEPLRPAEQFEQLSLMAA